jgi:site-specific DNA recombinase
MSSGRSGGTLVTKPILAREAAAGDGNPKRAALYLRVSTPGQVNNDYNPEGISIPAQREAAQRKAAELGAVVVDNAEYVEPGRTATEIDKRPVYLEMVARIRERRDIDYVVVYQFSRIFRNSLEAAIAKNELRKLGVRVVSTTLDLGDTLEAQMVETIVHAVDEYQVKSSAADISYKMQQKIKNGGTCGRAKIGYLNIRDTRDGHEVRAIGLDPTRAPLIRQAFELYATGDYTFDRLQQTMADQGLTTRPTKRWTERALSVSHLHRMLRDPYYTGVVVHQGEHRPGHHPAIITAELFRRVQDVIDSRSGSGQRERIHHHYLRGLLFCGRCDDAGRQHRLIYTEAKGRNGELYAYYLCRGRQEGHCDLPFLAVDLLEDAVVREYANLRYPADVLAGMREAVIAARNNEQQTTRTVRDNLAKQLARLDVQEERLLDLAADGTTTAAKVRARLNKIGLERRRVTEHLNHSENRLTQGADLIDTALDLLEQPQQLYRASTDDGRRLLNQTFYDRLLIDEGHVIRAIHQPPFSDLHALAESWNTTNLGQGMDAAQRNRGRSQMTLEPTPAALTPVASLSAGLPSDHVSSKAILVEVAGIEPASFGEQSGLLRAQRAVVFSAPPVTHASRCRAQSLLGFPKPLRDREVR